MVEAGDQMLEWLRCTRESRFESIARALGRRTATSRSGGWACGRARRVWQAPGELEQHLGRDDRLIAGTRGGTELTARAALCLGAGGLLAPEAEDGHSYVAPAGACTGCVAFIG